MTTMIEPWVEYRNGCPPQEAEFDLVKGRIVCGEFVDIQRESFIERLQQIKERAKKGSSK